MEVNFSLTRKSCQNNEFSWLTFVHLDIRFHKSLNSNQILKLNILITIVKYIPYSYQMLLFTRTLNFIIIKHELSPYSQNTEL